MIEVLPTSTEPMRGFADRMMAMEGHSELSDLSEIETHVPGDPSILSVSCIHGEPQHSGPQSFLTQTVDKGRVDVLRVQGSWRRMWRAWARRCW